MRLDLSGSGIQVNTKPWQIQENMIAYMRLFAELPGMIMEDTAQLFWFLSKKPAPGDGIFRVRWDEADVDDRIDMLFTNIGQYIESVSWMTFPGDMPAALGKYLEARKMPAGPGGNWLWMDLSHLAPAPATPDGFHIECVKDDQMMAEWVQISEAGFEEELGCFYDAYARHGYGPKAFSLHYTGYLGDIPVTSGTLLDAGGTAAVYDISTPHTYRRQGFGGATTHFLLTEILNRGYKESWIWSSNIAKSLYQKLGFVDADFGVREYRWSKE